MADNDNQFETLTEPETVKLKPENLIQTGHFLSDLFAFLTLLHDQRAGPQEFKIVAAEIPENGFWVACSLGEATAFFSPFTSRLAGDILEGLYTRHPTDIPMGNYPSAVTMFRAAADVVDACRKKAMN